MAKLKDWILEMAEGEHIVGVVIGKMGWDDDYNSEIVPDYKKRPHGLLLSWETAEPLLDYEFDTGFGSPKCEAIWAWTESWVIAIGQYDGSTWPYKLPRKPIAGMPTMEGGG